MFALIMNRKKREGGKDGTEWEIKGEKEEQRETHRRGTVGNRGTDGGSERLGGCRGSQRETGLEVGTGIRQPRKGFLTHQAG